jgi:DHA1 family bicyclomycin/chloramphenicol resistance-like MFS transporter
MVCLFSIGPKSDIVIRNILNLPKGIYLKEKLLILFIILLSAFPPLSADLPLPALPEIAVYFGVDEFATNMTLVVSFVSFALSTLIWGPLSDKYGRKPTLLVGGVLNLAGSILCGMSASIGQLIFFRVIQGIGGGSANAISSAIVKDVYTGRKQESVLAVVQSMIMICPVIAPVIGALLQSVTSWRGIYYTQAIIGLVIILGTIAFKETIPEKMNVRVFGAIARLVPVLKHGQFALMLVMFSLPFISIMAWVSSSSYIYENFFGTSSQTYSYYFAITALGTVLGPMAYMWISRKISRYTIITACFVEMILAGIVIAFFGALSPLGLALLLLPTTCCNGLIRPPSTFMMLNNKEGDTGSASALIGSTIGLASALGMFVVSLFDNYILVIGMFYTIIGVACLFSWLKFFRHTRYETSENPAKNN